VTVLNRMCACGSGTPCYILLPSHWTDASECRRRAARRSRLGCAQGSLDLNLGGYDGLALRVRGDGQTFKVNLKTADQENTPEETYQASFDTRPGACRIRTPPDPLILGRATGSRLVKASGVPGKREEFCNRGGCRGGRLREVASEAVASALPGVLLRARAALTCIHHTGTQRPPLGTGGDTRIRFGKAGFAPSGRRRARAPAGEWVAVRLPWHAVVPVNRARVDAGAPPLNPVSVRQLGLVLSRFEFNGFPNVNHRPGGFELQARLRLGPPFLIGMPRSKQILVVLQRVHDRRRRHTSCTGDSYQSFAVCARQPLAGEPAEQ